MHTCAAQEVEETAIYFREKVRPGIVIPQKFVGSTASGVGGEQSHAARENRLPPAAADLLEEGDFRESLFLVILHGKLGPPISLIEHEFLVRELFYDHLMHGCHCHTQRRRRRKLRESALAWRRVIVFP